MPKFHIGKRGNSAICKAKDVCPLGGAESHGQSREEVQTIIDSYYESESQLENGKNLPETNNAFELAGQLKALKERKEKLSEIIQKGITFNKRLEKNQFRSHFGTKENIENILANNEANKAKYAEYSKKRDEAIAKYNLYRETEINKLKEESPFGDRLKISDKNKVFVENIQKNEWNEYNKIKNKLNEIQEKRTEFYSAFSNEEVNSPYSDISINQMKSDLGKLKAQPEPVDVSKEYNEYVKLESDINTTEQKYKDSLFKERTGHDKSELKAIQNDESNLVRIDNKGSYTNVYANHNGETYKVLSQNDNRLEVQTMNGDKKTLSMVTNWNWRMNRRDEVEKTLPKIYVIENDSGKKVDSPIKFTKVIYDSSD